MAHKKKERNQTRNGKELNQIELDVRLAKKSLLIEIELEKSNEIIHRQKKSMKMIIKYLDYGIVPIKNTLLGIHKSLDEFYTK